MKVMDANKNVLYSGSSVSEAVDVVVADLRKKEASVQQSEKSDGVTQSKKSNKGIPLGQLNSLRGSSITRSKTNRLGIID